LTKREPDIRWRGCCDTTISVLLNYTVKMRWQKILKIM